MEGMECLLPAATTSRAIHQTHEKLYRTQEINISSHVVQRPAADATLMGQFRQKDDTHCGGGGSRGVGENQSSRGEKRQEMGVRKK